MSDTFNQKSPKDPRNRGVSKPTYPWFSGELGIGGLRKIIYSDPDKPDQAYVEQVNHDASFIIQEASGLKNVLNNELREYTSKGHSLAIDGNHAEYGKSNKNSSYDKDIGSTSGGSHYRGSGKVENHGSAQGSVHNDSDGSSYKIANGDQIMTYSGHVSVNYEKDHVIGVNGNNLDIVGGEYGINAKGNVSIQSIGAGLHAYGYANVVANSPGPILVESKTQGVEIKGYANVHVDSQGAILIETPVSITIKCGSSVITLTPSGINITASSVSFTKV